MYTMDVSANAIKHWLMDDNKRNALMGDINRGNRVGERCQRLWELSVVSA